MTRHIGWKSLLAGLLVLLLAAGAAAESWPSETVTDAAGNTYKQVKKQDGGVEVWQFVGIFGSPDEALKAVGLSEEEGKKGREIIGDVPYEFDLKKLTVKEDQEAKILEDGDSVIFGIRSGESARIVVMSEESRTYITGLESTVPGSGIDDKLLFGDSLKALDEKAGVTDAVYEAEEGKTTELNPGESLTLKLSEKTDGPVRVQVKHENDKTYVIPYKVRKAAANPIRSWRRKPKTIRKPKTGTLKDDNGRDDVTKEETPKKTTTWRRQRTIGGIIPIEQIYRAFNQIYLQENRASGR